MTDPRLGLGGYVQDPVRGGFQLDRAKRLVRDGKIQWVAILVAEGGTPQRPLVQQNRQVVDEWRSVLNPLGGKVGIWVVHGVDPARDASHYQGWGHVDLAVCNAEDDYVTDPSRSAAFLNALGSNHPPLVCSTNGNPAQRPFDYRRWEQAGALLATQAYWQFDVVKYLTPAVAHRLAYLPDQVNVGPSTTSWWYRIWLKGKGAPVWAQTIGTADGDTMLRLKRSPKVYRVKIRRAPEGGLFVMERALREEPSGKNVGNLTGVFPDKRITPHISNEDGDFGRPSLADLTAKVAACPTRKVAVGVFTLDNASDAELAAVRAGMNA